MYKVLIVDDEIIVRHALKTLIRWDEGYFEYVGSAANGRIAMSSVQSLQPDIIITDMKMPDMDGIELIKRLMEQGFDGEIIVLSNYNDFELVREALKYGAHDYVLKLTVRTEEFMNILSEAVVKLESKKRSKPSNSNAAPKQMQELQIKTMLSWLYEADVDANLSDSNLYNGTEETYRLGDQETVFSFLARLEKPNVKQDLTMFENIAGEIFSASLWKSVILKDDGYVLIAAAYSSHDVLAAPKDFALRIESHTALYYNVKIMIVYAELAIGLEQLAVEIHKSKQAALLFFYRNAINKCISNRTLPSFENEKFRSSIEAIKECVPGLTTDWAARWEEGAADLIESGSIHRIHPKTLKRAMKTAVWSLTKALSFENLTSLDETRWLEWIEVAEFDHSLLKAAQDFIREASEHAGILANVSINSSEVRKALLYLEAHYSERITISDISAHVNLSEAYLCRVFKAKTDKSILTYLNELRMTKAYEMLTTGRYLVKEAAVKVGIEDPLYFNRLFKKHYGFSPKDAKK